MKPKVLLVSQEKIFADTLARKLAQWKMTFFAARDMAEATGLLTRGKIDVVLLDVRRQGSTVGAMVADFRRLRPQAETIMLSSAGNVAASMAGMQAGAADEVSVPFEEKSLRDKILALYQRQTAGNRSFFQKISDVMAAATFAQAGEFETATFIEKGGMRNGTGDNRPPETTPQNPERQQPDEER